MPPLSKPARRHHLAEAIGIVVAVAALLVIIETGYKLNDPASELDAGDALIEGLASWAVAAGYLVYVVVVFRLCGLHLSTWGYVWRAWILHLVHNMMERAMSWLVPWELGIPELLFVLVASPWLLGWFFLRIDVFWRHQNRAS